jgi:hypothetical protein
MSGNAHQRRIIKRAGFVDNSTALVYDVMRRFTYSAPPEAMPNLRAKIRALFTTVSQRLRNARVKLFGV